MPREDLKVLPDEIVARRLHEELNPESSPIASATRRQRKAPTFYSPPFGGGEHPMSDDDKALPAKKVAMKKVKQETKPEMAASSPGSGHALLRDDSAEGLTAPPRGRPPKRQKAEAPAATLGPRESHSIQEKPVIRSQPPIRAHRNSRELTVKDSASELGAPEGRGEDSSTERSLKAEPTVRLTRAQIQADEAPQQKAQAKAVKSDDLRARSGVLASESLSHGSDLEKPKSQRSIPKMPMCKHGPNGAWYRARKLGEQATRVNLEFPGLVGAQSVWLPKDSPRIWSGSLKAKHWKYLGDGAWEPKVPEDAPDKRKGKSRKRKLHESQGGQTISSSEYNYSDDEEIRIQGKNGTNSSVPATSEAAEARVTSAEGEGASLDTSREPGVSVTKAREAEENELQGLDGPEAKKSKGRRGRPAGSGKRKRSDVEEDEERGETVHQGDAKKEQELPKEEEEDEAKRRKTEESEDEEKSPEKSESREKEDRDLERPYSRRRRGRGRRGRGRNSGRHKLEQTVEEDSPPSPALQEEDAAEQVQKENGKTSEEGERIEEQLQDDKEVEALEALGALAGALSGQPGPDNHEEMKEQKLHTSARNRKRLLAKARALEPNGRLDSLHHSGSIAMSPRVALLAKVAEEEKAVCAAPAWKGSWKEKHIQRMEEVEAEEEAAEHEDLIDEFPDQAPAPLATKRPMRAIKIPRNVERAEPALKEANSEAVSPSPQRAGRGRGRWANHVKKGGRGPKAAPPDAPRAARRGGRGRGGRWGNRQQAHKSEAERPDSLQAFAGLVAAMDKRIAADTLSLNKKPHPFQKILDLPDEMFASCEHREMKDIHTFVMDRPPVPLFKAA